MRFGEFDYKWEREKLENCASIYDGTHQTPNYTKSGIRFISVENISNLYNSQKFISLDDFKKEFKIYPQINDVLMTRIGDIGTPAVVSKDDPLAYYVSLALIRPNKKLYFLYIYEYIQSPYFKKELWHRTLQIAFPKKINKEEIGRCKISLPQEKEQQKIADFLSLIDQCINTQSKIIEKYESLIKAISNKLFFNITNRVNLSEICSITTGKLDANQMDENGIYPFFTCGKETLKINRYAFDCEAILISGNGDIGRTKYYNGKFNAYQRTYILYNFKGSPIFIKYAIDYVLPKKVKEETQISAMPYIKLATLSELSIPYPDITIQIEDVQILDTLQTKIKVEKNFLEKLKEQKKYLLSNMFI